MGRQRDQKFDHSLLIQKHLYFQYFLRLFFIRHFLIVRYLLEQNCQIAETPPDEKDNIIEPPPEKNDFLPEIAPAPKYNSQELDRESNLYFFNARHYDPEIARFVTADTVVDGNNAFASWNRYMYVHGNPVMYKDPTGHNASAALQGIFSFGTTEETLSKMEDEIKQEQKQSYESASKQAIDNFDAETNSTTVNGVKFQLDRNNYNTIDKIRSTSGKLWHNLSKAAEESDVGTIKIHALNYGGNNSHGRGQAADITGLIKKGSTEIQWMARDKSEFGSNNPEPDLIKKFSEEFLKLDGSHQVYNPWQLRNSSNISGIRNLVDTYPDVRDVKRPKEDETEFIDWSEKKEINRNTAEILGLGYDHTDHGHFSVTDN